MLPDTLLGRQLCFTKSVNQLVLVSYCPQIGRSIVLLLPSVRISAFQNNEEHVQISEGSNVLILLVSNLFLEKVSLLMRSPDLRGVPTLRGSTVDRQ